MVQFRIYKAGSGKQQKAVSLVEVIEAGPVDSPIRCHSLPGWRPWRT